MEKLNKQIESYCEDCELWIKLENCKQCLFNVLHLFDWYSPFSWDDEDDKETVRRQN